MKIGFDGTIFLLQNIGGISNYWYNLIANISEKKSISLLYYPNKNNNLFLQDLDQLSSLSKKKTKLRFFERYRSLTFSDDVNVVHSSYLRKVSKGIPTLHTVHDCIYEKFDTRLVANVHKYQKYQALKTAKKIICISNSTKRDVCEFYPWIDPSNLHVIHNGVSDVFLHPEINDEKYLALDWERNQNPFFLYVGGRGFCKNFEMVLDLFSSCRQNENVKLICVGNGFQSCELKLIKEKNLEEHIIVETHVNSTRLRWLYLSSRALLMPSLYEGFGLPAAEATCLGVPVIGSNTSSIPEACSYHEFLFDPSSLAEGMNAVRRFYEANLPRVPSEISRAARQKYNWKNVADQYEALYSYTLGH